MVGDEVAATKDANGSLQQASALQQTRPINVADGDGGVSDMPTDRQAAAASAAPSVKVERAPSPSARVMSIDQLLSGPTRQPENAGDEIDVDGDEMDGDGEPSMTTKTKRTMPR